MGLISGIIVGMGLGIGLMFGFAYLQGSRSKRRSEVCLYGVLDGYSILSRISARIKILIDTDLLSTLPNSEHNIVAACSRERSNNCSSFCEDDSGRFTQDPPRSMLNWLNAQLKKIWPYVDQAASALIKSSVEPILEQYRPMVLSSLTFSKLTLGTVAPQFIGVSIIDVENDSGGITMELEVQWDGNPHIELDIRTRVGVGLPFEVKNIGFTGVFRLILKPLVNELPCFGAICYSLKEKKKLDFKLNVIGGDLSSIPGISDAIEETIRDALEDSLTWPVRQIIPILPGDYSDLSLKPVGILEVKLIQAKELANKDLIGKSDPFAELFVRPLRSRMQMSKTINNQLNPIWNENFEFVVEDISTQHLTVRVFDNEGIQASELIGCAQVCLNTLEPGKVKEVWLKLVKDLEIQRDNKNRGQVQLELLYCPHGMEGNVRNIFRKDLTLTSLEKKALQDEPEAAEPKRKDVIIRGVLTVTVISAEDLPATDLIGKSDPYVVLKMKKSGAKYKTRVLNEVLNPIWNQTFDIVVEDGLHDMLILEVFDHDTFGKEKIGRCIMTLTRVILEGEYQDSYPLDGAKSGNLNLHLKWTGQPLYRES